MPESIIRVATDSSHQDETFTNFFADKLDIIKIKKSLGYQGLHGIQNFLAKINSDTELLLQQSFTEKINKYPNNFFKNLFPNELILMQAALGYKKFKNIEIEIERLDELLPKKISVDKDISTEELPKPTVNVSDTVELKQGPARKNTATLIVEELLHYLAYYGPAAFLLSIDYTFQREPEYQLSYAGKIINLSLLLTSANLTHLELSNDTVIRLGSLLQYLIEILARPQPVFQARLDTVSEVLRKSIYCYAGSEDSFNMNRLFRGQLLQHPIDNNILSYYIITVSLVTFALNRAPLSLTDAELQSVQARKVLIRKEDRSVDEVVANGMPVKYSSLTSTSQLSESEFNAKNQYFRVRPTTLFFKNPPLISSVFGISRMPFEGEVIIPPGIYVACESSGENTVSARIVYHAEERNTYWPMHALRYFYAANLCQKYQDKIDTRVIGSYQVERPNHGLAHSYRVMSYIKLIIDYFVAFAKDPQFKKFCINMTEYDLLSLEVAAASSVTGRQSEVNFKVWPMRCAEYRKDSAANFSKYIMIHSDCLSQLKSADESTEHYLKRMMEVIEYMSNPNYNSEFNTAKNESEKIKRHFLHTILIIAHNLDLFRCYNSLKAKESLKVFYNNTIESSDDAQAAFVKLQQYAVDLMIAQGDMLMCRLEQGVLIDDPRDYQPQFGEVSNSIKALERVSAVVNIPTFDFEPGADHSCSFGMKR